MGAEILLFYGLLLVCSFLLYLRSIVLNLLEAFDDVRNVGLVSVILDGDSLGFEIRNDALDTFLETLVALDLLFAILAMHLRIGGEHNGLDVFCQSNHSGQHHGT